MRTVPLRSWARSGTRSWTSSLTSCWLACFLATGPIGCKEAPQGASPGASKVASEGASQEASTVGCGQPAEAPWLERTEEQLAARIESAKACARSRGVKLLLAFGAPWCADCREMLRLEGDPVVKAAMAQGYEEVRINVGEWDRHQKLRELYGVKAIAHFVVLDPSSSAVLAQTTLEPITGKGERITAARWADWLRAPK